MCALVKTLLALPVLGLISIPLILSAWLTTTFALTTLFIRLAIVYIEVGYGLLANIFALPTYSSSLLTFTATEPSTPITGLSRRNSSYALLQSRRSNDFISSWTLSAAHDDLANRKKDIYARHMVEAHNLPTTPFLGLPVSGDERRDFEGVGGWRLYPDSLTRRGSSHPVHEKPLSSASSSSAQSVAGEIDLEADIDADERAWLSLNHRLELPSHLVTLGAGSAVASTMHSPNSADPLSPRSGGNVHTLVSSSTTSAWPYYPQHQYPGQRHHHRSHTTSSLTTSNRRTGGGLSLALSTRPDRESGTPASPSALRLAPFMTPQPYSHTQTRPPTRTLPGSSASHANASLSHSGDGLGSGLLGGSSGNASFVSGGGGGYFALQRPGSYYMPALSTMGSPSASGFTSPGTEDRDASPSQLMRSMAHYPTSVRHRRRSISGPHSRGCANGERG